MITEDQQGTSKEKTLFKNELSDADSLSQELEACKIAQEEWKDKCIRAAADLINFQRRMEKEQANWAYTARVSILIPLLEIVDNFDRALATDENVSEGIRMIRSSCNELLKKSGVKEVSYESFDPTIHEAVMNVESPEHTEGEIVQVMQKGYMLNDYVLRPAQVSIAK